jgi:hypothetical protein
MPCSRHCFPRRRSVLHATHTRNMEELGGLAKRMPRTAFFSHRRGGHLRVTAANGFASEWLTINRCRRVSHDPEPDSTDASSGAILALTGPGRGLFAKHSGSRSGNRSAEPRRPAKRRRCCSPSHSDRSVRSRFVSTVFQALDPVTQQLTGHQLSTQPSSAHGLVLPVWALGTVSPLA